MERRNKQAVVLMWQAMTHPLKDGFTIEQVAKAARVDYTTAHKYVQGLKGQDYVVCLRPWIPSEPTAAAVYVVAKNTGPLPPMPRNGGVLDPNIPGQRADGMSRLWRVLRMVDAFEVSQVAGLAELREQTVRTYLSRLIKAGYVVVLRPRESGTKDGGGLYRLERDTGPLAPIFKRGGEVFDPNVQSKRRNRGKARA